jgi:tRNA pseudouridine55 synthase
LTPPPEGLLLIHKPAGPTSHDIVAWVRRATGQRRVGHTGTLDPPASGLLVLALGRATRLIRFLPDAPKLYEGALALGLTTETDDLTGTVVSRTDDPLPSFAAIENAIAKFVGKQSQIPPAVSARKVDGERLYRKARRGEFVQAPASEIEVFRFDVEPGTAEGRIPFRASVSKGTYIRSLARDLGERLGCGGALAELRRTAIGPFELDSAVDPPERGCRQWDPGTTIPLDQAPLALPTQQIQAAEIEQFAHGGVIDCAGSPEGWVRVTDPEDRILGVGQSALGRMTPRVVLVDPAG